MIALVCAASPAEARACERGIARAGLSDDIKVLMVGMGPRKSGLALAKFLDGLEAWARPRLVISSGIAGAVSRTLALDSWVTAETVAVLETGERLTYEALPLALASVRACTMVSSDELVLDHVSLEARVQDLAEPRAVDMESGALARAATGAGCRFAVFRVISDTPDRPLPSFLSSVAGALSAPTLSEGVWLGIKGARSALADPRGMARLAKDVPKWSRLLSEGWSEAAGQVIKIAANC